MFTKKRVLLIIVSIVIIALLIAGYYIYLTKAFPKTQIESNNNVTSTSTEEPKVTTSTLISNLSHPWDLSFMDATNFAYSQRGGQIRGFNTETKQDWLITKPDDIYNTGGEGGLLGLKVDVDFKNNKYIYTCMNVKGPYIHIIRWKLSNDYKSIANRTDIITDIPSNTSTRHSGCRITMDKDGILWIGTGDTATGTVPQNPKSLGGKVLRVNRDGKGVEGNLTAPFDSRIFSYGHRNIQGLALFDTPKDGVYGYTVEQGTDRDDEVNLLKSGNFGWDPIPGFNESRPMTDLTKFPNAIPAIWKSGFPTLATSGMVIVHGSQWKAWENAVMLGVLKGQQVRLQKYDSNYKLLRDDKMFTKFGRIRTIVENPNNNELYLLTDNGNDKIIKVSLVSD